MNDILQKFARDWLKENIITLDEPKQDLFKRLYGGPFGAASTVDKVIDNINSDNLDWAMMQVINTINKYSDHT